MKRDLDLCREILRQIEAHTALNEPATIEVEGRSSDDITYQLHQLRDGGLIEAEDVSDLQRLAYKPLRLTWAGHEFLDAARNDTLWNEAKHEVGSRLGSIPFELVQAVLVDLGRKLVGLG